jgi:hypothetical protein
MVSSAEADFHPPKPYVTETLYQLVKVACPKKDWFCFEKELLSLTATYGPHGPLDTFELMRSRGDIDPSIDAHHFVHHIGHHTAMTFGSNGRAFALCPTVYHYGCFHGFFQYELGMGGSTQEAAVKICEDLDQSRGECLDAMPTVPRRPSGWVRPSQRG